MVTADTVLPVKDEASQLEKYSPTNGLPFPLLSTPMTAPELTEELASVTSTVAGAEYPVFSSE
jgi:hypothetical protein